MLLKKAVKFIRKGGKVIPIKAKEGAAKAGSAIKKAGKKAGKAMRDFDASQKKRRAKQTPQQRKRADRIAGGLAAGATAVGAASAYKQTRPKKRKK